MMKEIKMIVSMIIDFCRNNLDIWAVAGISLMAILFLIVVSSFIKSKMTSKKPVEEVKLQEVAVAVPLEPVEVPKEEPKVETQEEPVVEAKTEVCEEPKPVVTKNTTCIDAILGELAMIPTEGVKEIEIKIQGAEVKVTYANQESLQLIAKELKAERTKPEVASCECQEHETKEADAQKSLEETEDKTPAGAEKPVEEQAEKTEGKAISKFGPDNLNVAKSGRVYSEEELLEQIQD